LASRQLTFDFSNRKPSDRTSPLAITPDIMGKWDASIRGWITKLQGTDNLDDLVQDTWLRVWERRATYRGTTFSSWLYCIARTVTIDNFRKRSSRPEKQLPEDYDQGVYYNDGVEDRDHVEELVDRLHWEPGLHVVGVLTGQESTRAAAERLGVAESTIRWRGREVAKRLRDKS
jgi:RNA polymerase sigma factor (sigma-70 family)